MSCQTVHETETIVIVMSRLAASVIERYAKDFRVNQIDTGLENPVNVKTILTKLGILTLFRPLSEGLCGLSIISTANDKFILVNSNNNIGRQDYVINLTGHPSGQYYVKAISRRRTYTTKLILH